MNKKQVEELLDKFATGNVIDGEGALKEILVAVVGSSIPTEVTNINAINLGMTKTFSFSCIQL